jgi:hypothetical protein
MKYTIMSRKNKGIDITKEIFADHDKGPKGPNGDNGRFQNASNRNNYDSSRDYRPNRNRYDNESNDRNRHDNDSTGRNGYNNDRGYSRNGGFNRDNRDRNYGRRDYDDRNDSGWNRGSEFEKYSKEVDDAEQKDRTGIQFFDRGLSRDEIKLRNYIYDYLKSNIESQIKENHDTGNPTDKLVFNIKEDDMIDEVFNGNKKVNVYDMLHRKRENHKDGKLFNPIASSVFKALNGFQPTEQDGKPTESVRLTYSGLTIRNVTIDMSNFSNYVWSIQIITVDNTSKRMDARNERNSRDRQNRNGRRNDRNDRNNKNDKNDKSDNRERIWNRTPKLASNNETSKPTESTELSKPVDETATQHLTEMVETVTKSQSESTETHVCEPTE